MPQLDDDALKNNDEYVFNIKNTGSIDTYYKVHIENVCNTDETYNFHDENVSPDVCIPSEYIRIGIKKDDGNYIIKTLNNDDTLILGADTLHKNSASEKYTIKVWLDISTPSKYSSISDTGTSQISTFVGKLNIEAEQRPIKYLESNCLYFTITDGKANITNYKCSYVNIAIPKMVKREVDYELNRDKCVENEVAKGTERLESEKKCNQLSFDIRNKQDVIDEYENNKATYFESGILNKIKDTEVEYEVTSIADNVFKNKKLSSVDIANTITKIGNNAFDSNVLTSITLPVSITSIGNEAFANNKLDYVVINTDIPITKGLFKNNQINTIVDSLGAFPKDCFTFDNTNGTITGYTCDGVINISIPSKINNANVINIADNAFENKNLYTVDFSKASNLKTIGNNSFASNIITALNLPTNLVSLGSNSFKENKITRVNLDALSITTIPTGAFANNNIESLITSSSLTSIEEDSFINNKNLKSLNLTNSVSLNNIGNTAFYNDGITSVTLPNSVKKIGNSAFSKNDITKVKLGTSIESLGTYAFSENKIKSINMSNLNISTLPEGLLYKNNLENISISSNVVSISNKVFSNNDISILDLTSASNLTNIGSSSFELNNISALDLSNTKVSNIENLAFASNNLVKVILPNTISLIGNSSFYKTSDSNKKLKEIINPTNNSFNWVTIINNISGFIFATGSVTNSIGNVTISQS